MGTRGTHASDGTPRCSEPKQDAEGRWFCPACGRAEGFKSKMAVLGHLRSCRPGKPALRELLGTPAMPPASSSSVDVPTPNESAQINGMGAILSRLDQMQAVQAQHSRALGNHITHLSGQTATSPTAPVGGFSWGKAAAWGGVAVLGLAVAQAAQDRSRQAVRHSPDPRLRRVCKAVVDAGGELPPECADVDSGPLAGLPDYAPRASKFDGFKAFAGVVKEAAGAWKAVKSFGS